MIVKCRSCGRNMRFSIEKQLLCCEHCNNTYNVDEIEKEDSPYFDVVEYRCADCGAKLITTEDTEATAFCSYCGSTSIITGRLNNIKKPDAIIPFQITKEKCKELYLQQAKNAFFAPAWLKKSECIDSFRAIYMPYWRYKAHIHCDHAKIVTLDTKREGDYIRKTEKYWQGRLNADIDTPTHDASNAFADDISEAIGFSDIMHGELSFHPAYMSGFYADMADVEPQNFKHGITTAIAQKVKAGLHLNSEPDVDLRDKQLIYYPVWFMCQRKGKEMTYAAVNGVSGSVVADFPINSGKFFALSAILTVILFLLIALTYVLRPEPAFWVSAVIYGMGAFVVIRERIKWVHALEERNIPLPFLVSSPLLTIINILSFFCTLLLAFSRDNILVYTGVLVLSGLTVLNILNVFHIHQIISRRRPPQFNRKGADDNA